MHLQDWNEKEKRMQEAGAKWGQEAAEGEQGEDDDDELPFGLLHLPQALGRGARPCGHALQALLL